MTEYQFHYQGFNVLDEKEHWDPHTQKIVGGRTDIDSFYPLQYLTEQEADTLTGLSSILLDDERYPVIAFVIYHFDSLLKANIGESQRKVGVPKQTELIRDGLALLDEVCTEQFGSSYTGLTEEMKIEVFSKLMLDNFPLQAKQKQIPTKEFMQKISSEAIAAYYSHPTVWSEIGYAGPAYPRGYVRSELGLTDPWEAKRSDQ